MRYADHEGELAVRIARDALEAFVLGRPRQAFEIPKRFEEKAGAFVTLNEHPSGELRGCIGYPHPFFALLKSIEKGAEGAAEDPRFPRLRSEELDCVSVEVSILTPPQLIDVKKPKDLPKQVTVGIDGLTVAQGPFRGLLLPQVAVDNQVEAGDSVSESCIRGGLLPAAGLDAGIRGDELRGAACGVCG